MRSLLALALFLVSTLCVGTFAQETSPTHFQVIGYYAEHNVYGNFSIKQIDTSGAAALLTQLDYAFGRVAHNRCEVPEPDVELKRAYSAAESVDGTADTTAPNQLRGSFHQLQELKRKYPKLKVMISFGGWGNSEGFSDAAEPQNLEEFVRSCVNTFIKGNFASGIHAPRVFDGIDVDWEYPVDGGMIPGRPEDKRNMTLLAAEFRRQLDAVRPGLLLTTAVPAGAEDYTHYDLRAISRYFDYLSLMAYDLHWNTEKTTNLHSALFHDPADKAKPPFDKHYGAHAVTDFLQAGVPARKIVFGAPFYGKGWTGVADNNHGLYQPAKGPSQRPSSYRDLKALPATADAQFDQNTATCTIWNQGEFWSYDCPQAMQAKLRFIHQHHLGGVMFWELGDDTPDAELLKTMAISHKQ